MTQPKLREGAKAWIIRECLDEWDKQDLILDYPITEKSRVIAAVDCILNNLHKLLEPIDWGETHADAHKIVDSIIDKRVAIVGFKDE